MSCNTFIPIMDLVREVEALLAANYIDKDDPRITGGVFTNPTIKEGFLLDVQAREEFCRLVQECGLDAPFGKMWLSRPLYPDQMFVSYEDSGEPQTKWRTIQAVLESAGVFGPEATSLSSRLASEIERATTAENEIISLVEVADDNIAANKVSIASNTTAISDENSRAVAAEGVLTSAVDALELKDLSLQSQVNSIGGGKKAYVTYALMVADKDNIDPNSSIDVTNDTDPLKIGTYSYDGAVFTKSIYDVEAIVRTKVLNTFKTKALMDASALPNGADAQVTNDTVNNGLYVKTEGAWVKGNYDPLAQANLYTDDRIRESTKDYVLEGDYTGTATGQSIMSANNAFGMQIKTTGTIEKIKVGVQSGVVTSPTILVYEKYGRGLKLISSTAISNFLPNADVELETPINVVEGNIVLLKTASQVFLKTNDLFSTNSVYVIGANTTVGTEANYNNIAGLEMVIAILVDSGAENKDATQRDLIIDEALNLKEQKTGKLLDSPPIPGNNLNTYAVALPEKIAKRGVIKEVSLTTRSINKTINVIFSLIKPTPLGYVVSDINTATAITDSVGVAKISGDTIGLGIITPDDFLMVSGNTNLDAPLQGGDAGAWFYLENAKLIKGDVVSIKTVSGTTQSLEIIYEYPETSGGSMGNATLKYSKSLINEKFTTSSLPSDWTANGVWSFSSGAKPPTTGGWTTTLLSAGYSAMANRVYRSRVRVTDASSIFGLCTMPIEPNAGAAVAMVDGTAKKLIIYTWDGASAGTNVNEVTIPPLIANRDYLIEVEKEGWFSTVSLTDTVTLEKTVIEHKTFGNYAQFHGQAGIVYLSGDITVKNFSFNALYPDKPRAILIGDSNSERAVTILPNETWAFKLADMRAANADVIVAARSGDETPNFLKRKDYDLKAWQPKFVVWALGTNDIALATWRTNMQQNILDTIAIGAEPILTTPMPRVGAQALMTSMGEDVRSGYFGDYRYIDFASAVTLNNDKTTWDPAYNSGDNVHVNAAGQQRLLEQALVDIPDLLY